jgi:hypothetical protein
LDSNDGYNNGSQIVSLSSTIVCQENQQMFSVFEEIFWNRQHNLAIMWTLVEDGYTRQWQTKFQPFPKQF